MSQAMLGILVVTTIIAVACQSSAQVAPAPSSTPTRFDPTLEWLYYDNPRFGISLRYPPGLALLLAGLGGIAQGSVGGALLHGHGNRDDARAPGMPVAPAMSILRDR